MSYAVYNPKRKTLSFYEFSGGGGFMDRSAKRKYHDLKKQGKKIKVEGSLLARFLVWLGIL